MTLIHVNCGCSRDAAPPRAVAVADAKSRRDPTGTLRIRVAFRRELEARVVRLNRLVRQHVGRDDALGLDGATSASLASAMRGNLSSPELKGGGAASRVRGFQQWFDEALAQVLTDGNGRWVARYVRAAYEKGFGRGVELARGRAEMNPERAAVLGEHAGAELQGVAEAVSRECVRAASRASMTGLSAQACATLMLDRVKKIGLVRGRALVEFSVVQAHADATLDAFAAIGVTRVGLVSETRKRRQPPPTTRDSIVVDAPRKRKSGGRRKKVRDLPEMVEILTAGDDEVCDECEALAGESYSIDEARDLIPAHPWCRCAFVPAEDARFAHPGAEE